MTYFNGSEHLVKLFNRYKLTRRYLIFIVPLMFIFTDSVLDANDKSKDKDRNCEDDNDFLKDEKATWEKSTSIFHYKIHLCGKTATSSKIGLYVLHFTSGVKNQVNKIPAKNKRLYVFRL